MPPRRNFSGKADYMQRNLHDDLLEQLRNSTNDVVKGRELLLKNPRMMLGQGLCHIENLLKDVDTSVGGMDLFKRWFSQRNQGTPMSNIWNFDVGKLVVPSVF